MDKTDVIIIGSGIAALQTALKASKTKNVVILTKSNLRESNSYLAQGGIATAFSNQDKPAKHMEDTIIAGRKYNNQASVAKLVEEAKETIMEIISKGMQFDRNEQGEVLLGMEGAHSERRILHSQGDQTGKHLVEHFLTRLQKAPIQVLEQTTVISLLIGNDGSCIGVKAKKSTGEIENIYSAHTVIATGGCGSLFKLTSNANTVSGDGMVLALQVGAKIRDMEFIQFHPTLLYINGKTKGLVTEAVRGEGAKLVTEDGTEVMKNVHPLLDLAPRHIVAQTIFQTMQKGQQVYLDISNISNFEHRFPTVASSCRENGIDLRNGKIPVAPGNHFLMGGIETNILGETSVTGLYAVGEAACNGVHGANRLASNSLLEGLVYGKVLGDYLAEAPVRLILPKNSEKRSKSIPVALPLMKEIREYIMKYAGISRNAQDLKKLISWLESYHLEDLFQVNPESLTETECSSRNGVIVAWLIAKSAYMRTESRGGHFRSDYPLENNSFWLNQSIVWDLNAVIHELKGTKIYEQVKA